MDRGGPYQELLDAAVYTRAAIEEGIAVPAHVYANILHSITETRALINARTLKS